MNWDDDDRPSPPHVPQQNTAPVRNTSPEVPMPEVQEITFRDIFAGTTRTGRVLRSITSNEHTNPRLGKLPITTLYLVTFESETKKDDLAVIDTSLIIRPLKPRP